MEHATVAVNIYCRAAPRDLTEFDYKIPAPSSDEHFLPPLVSTPPAPLRLPQSPIRRMAEEGSEMADRNNGPAIGIDLGTTYSCVGVWQHGRVVIVTNDQGNLTTPSCVAFTDSERLVGDPAKNQVARNTSNTVFGEFTLPCQLPPLPCTPPSASSCLKY
jgi:L1 cell adhesion molecule like protein